MTASTEAMVRSAGGYDRARQALAAIQHSKVWATAVNYELWLHAVCEPASPLAEEIGRLRATGMPITESMSEELAATFLPRVRMTAQMQETGEQLSRQLGGVSEAAGQASDVNRSARLLDLELHRRGDAADEGVEVERFQSQRGAAQP